MGTLVAPDEEKTTKNQLINEDQEENEVQKKLKQKLHNKMQQNEELNSTIKKSLVAPDKEETAKIQLINEDQEENEVQKKLKQELHNKMQSEELNSLITKSGNTISSMTKENNQKDYEIQMLSEQLKEKNTHFPCLRPKRSKNNCRNR